MIIAPKLYRFLHFIIDGIIVLLMWYLFLPILNSDLPQRQFLYLISIGLGEVLYYTIFEYSSGQTIGKMVTKSKVISIEEEKVSLTMCLIRNTLRLLPFFMISLLWHDRGLHDIFSKTVVIKKSL